MGQMRREETIKNNLVKLTEYRVTYNVYIVKEDGVVRNNGYIIVKAKTINDALGIADGYLKSCFGESYKIILLVEEREYEFQFTNQ